MPHDLHMPCRFRPATGAEADTLADIRVAAMRPSLEAIGRFSPERARERFLKGFDPADTTVIECGEEIAGFFVVRRRKDHLYLDHLYVTPSRQGRGLGWRVVSDLQARASAEGLPIRLMALNGSPANEFYKRCGFEVVSSDALDTIYVWQARATS
ncbi:GNAT family N-acetyltransferase [Sagittula sp. P11]|uniref:GNAT family N-acetyltransferase n=1 Tax=Sagittula sp. P11 TaxID=2009329 RepID=UPI0020C78600|nr:GNAT family N-acetyltransferase [Sagittula sp. P11]